MKGKFRILGHVGLALFVAVALMLAAVPAAKVEAATAVTDVWVQLSDYGATNTAIYSIYFTPGADLTAATDTINVIFPTGTDASGVVAADVTVYPDGDLIADPTFTTAVTGTIIVSATRITVTTPVALTAGTEVRLVIADVDNPGASDYTLKVYTSQETTMVTSNSYTIGATDAGIKVTGVAFTTQVGPSAEYVVYFVASASAATLTAGWGKVTVIFPPEVTLPPGGMVATDVACDCGAIPDGVYTDCTVAPTITLGRFVSITISEDLASGEKCYVKFKTSAGIDNPTLAETYVGKVYTSSDAGIVDDSGGYAIAAGAITKLAFVTADSDAVVAVNTVATLKVRTEDAYGNVKNVGANVTVNLSSTSGTGRFDTGSGGAFDGTITSVTISANNVTFYYKDTVVGSPTITAAESPSLEWTYATWDITVEATHVVSLYDSNDILITTYTTIAAAVAAAMTGDTIKVGPGTYTDLGNVRIEKSVTLISDTGDYATTGTIITGASSFRTKADDITIKGFKFLDTRSNVIHAGFAPASDVTISYNSFTNRTGGCLMDLSTPTGISANNSGWLITRNYIDGVIGVDAAGLMGTALWLGFADGYEISYNTIKNCDFAAMEVGAGCQNCIITQNTIDTTRGPGIQVTYDDGLTPPDNITITHNTITNAFTEDDLFDFWTGGVKLSYEGLPKGAITLSPGVTNITISRNTLTGNHNGVTVFVREQTASEATVHVQYNDISGNSNYGINNSAASGSLDAEYNWWGDATGPSTDPDATTPTAYGAGDPITTLVTYSPWLTKSQALCVTSSYPALNRTASLSVGWNTLSTPAKLISTADSVGELVPTGMVISYWYDAFNEDGPCWESAATHVLNPCDAVYIKMSSAQRVLFQVDGDITWVPSKDLAAGWNMIGQTKLADDETEVEMVASVTGSWSQLVSPSMNTNEWIYTAANVDNPVLGEGYWIFMTSAATLGGFTLCPIAPAY